VAWTTERVTINNFERSFEVYRQESKLSCGPACVLMVNNLKYGAYTSEAIAKVWFAKIENRGGGIAGVPKGSAKADRVLNWRHESLMDTILRVLQSQKIGASPQLSTDVRVAAECTPHMPGILRVQWVKDDGAGGISLLGGHFVVCVGHTENNIWIYLDPQDGVVTVPRAPPLYVSGGSMGVFNQIILV
jgi:hypothetical protein